MDYRVFCPKCGKQTITQSMGNSYSGTGLIVTGYCNNCDIYISCNKESYIERMVIRENPNPKKVKVEDEHTPHVEILKDDKGEYIDFKLIKENRELNIQFYIEESNVIPSRVYNDFKSIVCSDGKITFKLKQATLNPIKTKMTKEEIEKELGYEIEMVEK